MGTYYNPPADLVTLTLDNDEELVCEALVVFEANNTKYLAVAPQVEDEEESSIFIYRYIDNSPEEPQLENIDTDEELELASAAFDEWVEEQELLDEE